MAGHSLDAATRSAGVRMTTANIVYFGLGALVGMAVAIIAVLPEYNRHEKAIREIVNR